MSSSKELGWWQWFSALFHVIIETLFQRVLTCHLPQRLPLPVLTNFTCIVTGATSGIGLETAKQLAEAGAHVVLACRNVTAAQALIYDWQKSRDPSQVPLDVEVMELDLLSLSSVRRFAKTWESRQGPLNVLINNAGIFSMSAPKRFSQDGYEEHMQVNHLAPALLTILLLPSLLRGTPSRVVNVNSDMQYFGSIDPDDLGLSSDKRKHSSISAYGGSKLAQILFSSTFLRKLPNDCGVHIMCVNPGIVMTNVTRTLPKLLVAAYRLIGFFSLTPIEGARSVLHCSTDLQVSEYANGLRDEGWPCCALFSSDCKPAATAKRAHDTDLSARVYEKTLELVGIPHNFLDEVVMGKDIDSFLELDDD